MSLVLLGILNSQVSGGAAGAYDLLETQVLSSSASSVTFTGLGSYSNYKHLQIRMTGRTDRASSVDLVYLKFNSDTGSNYAAHRLYGSGSSVTSAASTSTAFNFVGYFTGANDASSDSFGSIILDILDFSNTNKNTTTRSLTGNVGTDTSIALISNLWMNTNAVTSVNLDPIGNFVSGSRFSLYGVK